MPDSVRSFMRKGLDSSTGHRGARGAVVGLLVLTLVGCAVLTPGSDPVVVRGEDILVNAKSAYQRVFDLHDTKLPDGRFISQLEPPAVYDAIEKLRTKAPRAWRAFDLSLQVYEDAKRAGDTTAAIEVLLKNYEKLEQLLEELAGLFLKMPKGGTP